MAYCDRVRDVAIQEAPNYASTCEIYSFHLKNTKAFATQAEKEPLTFEEEIQFSEILIKSVSIQSTTDEVTIYKTFPSLHEIRKMFEQKIMPYYLSLKNKARMKAIWIIYGMSYPPAVKNVSIEVTPEDFEAMEEWLKDEVVFDAVSTPKTFTDVKQELIEEPVDAYPQEDISEMSVLKVDEIYHKDAAIQTTLDDSFMLKKVDIEEIQETLRDEDTKHKIIEEQLSEEESKIDKLKLKGDEKPKREIEKPVIVQPRKTVLETKDLELLKQFLLEKDVWDVVFWQLYKDIDEKSVKMKSISQRCYTLLTEEVSLSDHWADNFIADLVKKFSNKTQDMLNSFKAQIQLRDQSMKLYWELISPPAARKLLRGTIFDTWDTYFHNYQNVEFKNESSLNILESESVEAVKKEVNDKLYSVFQHVNDIRNSRKEKQTTFQTKDSAVDLRLLQKDVLEVVQALHRQVCEEVRKITDVVQLRYLPYNDWIKAGELLNHDGTIYRYSELQEIFPRLWIGDFSAIRTSCRLRGIKFQIVLGNCKKCFTDFHDKCSSLMPRPYIYKPPVFTVNGNLHQMNVEAIDKATFPIFQYFRSTCDYIDKSLSSSEEANVAVISRQGKCRCVAIVLAYLMFKRNLTLREAVKQIKQKRAIRLNLGFLIQLVQFDRKIHRERKKPVTVRMKNVFEIRKKDCSESFWFREEQTVEKPTKSYIFLDDRFSRPDLRLGLNTNVFLHSPLSAPGPHFYTDIEHSILETPLYEMAPFNDMIKNALRWDEN
ncbi:dual specificity phosphatase DUPD1 [Trichonephila inaurata madagascariensis]|uniref:Dual specificity phosphatase DUPD1 n=1 Tax=Trichonephila inaurata madagascariensis TaxID=2747483 RepID=A0A8X6YMW6_9ARAC|nr:dual specificity phosphatase DUPD1 [Trichonephila inaurata madagascariensis]